MYCPTCGRFFPGQGSECELCGAAIPEDPSKPALPDAPSSDLSFSVRRDCRNCHAPLPDGTEVCAVCGESRPVARPAFAGFWLRSAAQLVDLAVLVGILLGMFIALAMVVVIRQSMNPQDRFSSRIDKFFNGDSSAALGFGILAVLLLVPWIYFAAMESSSSQATLGKKLLGLRVTDGEGRRIGFARATGRFLGKFISLLLAGGGFVMAAFSEKKQALHDVMVDCLVIRRR